MTTRRTLQPIDLYPATPASTKLALREHLTPGITMRKFCPLYLQFICRGNQQWTVTTFNGRFPLPRVLAKPVNGTGAIECVCCGGACRPEPSRRLPW